MGVQREEIEYSAVDKTGPGTKSANANIESWEKKAAGAAQSVTKATDQANAAIVTVTDRSARSIERTVQNAERRLHALKSAPERLAIERSAALDKVGGDPEAVKRVTAAYDGLAEAQRKIEAQEKSSRLGEQFKKILKDAALLEEQSKRAAQATAAQLEAEHKSREATIRQLERQVALAGKVGPDRIKIEKGFAIDDLGKGATPEQLKRVTAAYNEMIAAQEKAAKTGSRLAEFIRNPLEGAARVVEDVTAKWGKFGLVAGAVGVAAVGAATQLFSMVSAASDTAEQYSNLADELGVTTDEIQILSRQAAIANVNIETFVGVQRKLSDVLASGGAANDAAVKRLDDMGISVVKASGGFRGTIDILRDFSAQLRAFPDHATKVQVLTDVFGRGAIAMLPLIEHFEELEQKAREVGPVLEADVIKRLAEANDKLDQMGLSWNRLKLIMAEKIVAVVEIFQEDKSQKRPGALGPNGDILKYLPVTQFPNVKPPDNLGSQAELATAAAARNGDKLIERFKGRQTVEGLNRELALLQTQQNTLGATIQSGLSETAARAAIQNFDAISKRIETVRGQIKGMTELPAKLQQAHDILLAAQEAEKGGMGKLFIEREKALKQYAGIKGAVADINEAFKIRIALEEKANKAGLDEATAARSADIRKQDIDQRTKFLQGEFEEISRIAELRRQTAAEVRQNQISELDTVRDAQLRNLEAINAQTIAGQNQVDQARANIEANYQEQRLQKQAAVIELEMNRELERYQVAFNSKLITEATFQSAREALAASADERIAALRTTMEANILAARESAQIASDRRITDHLRSTFEGFKRQAEGIFDATTRAGDGVFKALGNSLKTFALTAVKDGVTNQAAGFLTELTTGVKPQFVTEGGAGPLGRIASLLGIGAKPVFGGNGNLGDLKLLNGSVPVVMVGTGSGLGTPPFLPGGSGGGGLFGSLSSLGSGGGGGIFGRGGTPPFLPIGAGGIFASGGTTPPFVPAGAGAGGGGGIFGGLLGGLSSLKTSITNLGNLGRGRDIFAAGKVVPGSSGVGGFAGGAMLLGGSALAYDGLRRGGLVGLGQTAAGGALIGAKFGGPVGALIGGAIGAGAGLARLFIKGKAEKIMDRVKALYGISISKSFATDPLQGMIDQVGGDIDFGLRQPQVQTLLRSWAAQSGQNFALENKSYGVGLSLSGGRFSQTAVRENGVAIAYGGGLAPITGNPTKLITGQTPASSGQPAQLVVQSLQISVNGQSAQAALVGGMAKNPDVVSGANLEGVRSSYGRTALKAALMQPGAIGR